VLLGHNEGANPVEFLLHALAGCVTTTTVLHATARGIEIESLSTRLVGDIDLQGLLALADVPAGYQGIHIEMDIKAKKATDAELDELIGFAQAHSPVCNTVCRPVPVTWSGRRGERTFRRPLPAESLPAHAGSGVTGSVATPQYRLRRRASGVRASREWCGGSPPTGLAG
jgi:uncharacterized OsmC-like protein